MNRGVYTARAAQRQELEQSSKADDGFPAEWLAAKLQVIFEDSRSQDVTRRGTVEI